MVQLGSDLVHRCAGHSAARINGALVGVKSRKSRQQGRMNVDQSARIMGHKPRRQNPHKTSQYHQRGLVAVDSHLHRRIKSFACGILPVVNNLRRHTELFCNDQSVSI